MAFIPARLKNKRWWSREFDPAVVTPTKRGPLRMPEITVSGPHVNANVGHFRVSVDFGDRLVDFDPSFEIMGLSNALRSRNISKDICAQTANALVKENVPLDTVLMVLSRLAALASPDTLRGLETTE